MADDLPIVDETIHFLMLGPGQEPQWVRLVVSPFDDHWMAVLVEAPLPGESGTLKGLGFFARTPEEARDQALRFLGQLNPTN